MAQSKQPMITGFDVVVKSVVGHVDFSDVGSNGPVEAGFSIIGKHMEETVREGSYSFPGPAGETINVDITFEGGRDE